MRGEVLNFSLVQSVFMLNFRTSASSGWRMHIKKENNPKFLPREFILNFLVDRAAHRGGLKLHLQARQFKDLNRTAEEVSTP